MSKIPLVILATVITQALAQPVVLNDKSVQCYERECPNTTTACKKVIKTSDDKKALNTEIYCLDAQDMVLKEYKESKENPFGPSTTYQSTSFSGSYVSHHGGPVDININNNIQPDGIEDFS